MKTKQIEHSIMKFFSKRRLLDGYIGILGIVFFYKVLAAYHNFFYIFDFSLRYVFSISLCYHPQPHDYPMFQFIIKLFKFTLFDNGEKAAQIISERVAKSIAKRKENECKICGGDMKNGECIHKETLQKACDNVRKETR